MQKKASNFSFNNILLEWNIEYYLEHDGLVRVTQNKYHAENSKVIREKQQIQVQHQWVDSAINSVIIVLKIVTWCKKYKGRFYATIIS